MTTYFLLQEHSYDKYTLAASVYSINSVDPDHCIILACTHETQEYIQNITYFKANIRYRLIENKFSLAQHIKNWLTILKEEVKNGNDILFCDTNLIFIKQLKISESIKSQGIGFIKTHFDVPENKPELQYSINLLYVSSLTVIDKIEKLYRDSTTLFIDGKIEWSKNENNDILKAWANMPLSFADYDDGIICVSEYINGRGFLSSENFFAFDGSWKLDDLSYSGELKHEEDDIYAVNIRLSDLDPRIQELNKRLLNIVVQTEPSLMAAFNLKYSKEGKQDIGCPREKGIAHWDRTQNKSFYRLVDELVDTGLFNKTTVVSDYFVCNNRILMDKVGEKWLTNVQNKSFGIFAFDSDEKFSEIVSENDIKNTFFGYIPFNRKILEEIEPINTNNRKFDKSTPADLDWFIDHEENMDDYPKLLTNLSQHSHAMITKMTPSSRLAECAYLGVIPILDEGIVMDGLPELTGNTSDDINHMQAFYNKELTVDAIANKILCSIFS